MNSPSERDDRLRADLQSLRIERTAATPQAKRAGRRGQVARRAHRGRDRGGGAARTRRPARARQGDPGRDRERDRRGSRATLRAGPVPSGSAVVTGDRYVHRRARRGTHRPLLHRGGQSVRKGDPLVQLDDRDYRAAVGRIEAGSRSHRANTELPTRAAPRPGSAQSGVISDQELDVLENKSQSRTRPSSSSRRSSTRHASIWNTPRCARRPTASCSRSRRRSARSWCRAALPDRATSCASRTCPTCAPRVDVNEADLERVRMGGAARVTPDAFPDRHYAARW